MNEQQGRSLSDFVYTLSSDIAGNLHRKERKEINEATKKIREKYQPIRQKVDRIEAMFKVKLWDIDSEDIDKFVENTEKKIQEAIK